MTQEERDKYPIAGFAPGSYINKCCICKNNFKGDKRAIHCEPCAIKLVNQQNKQA